MSGAVRDDRQLLLALSVGGFLLMLLLPVIFSFRVDLPSFLPIFAFAAVPALALPYVIWRRLDAMRPALEATSLGFMLTVPVLVSTYAAMRAGLPMADPLLVRMDAAFGFNAPDIVRLVDRSPAAARLFGYSYSAFSYQLLLLPSLLCAVGHPVRAYRFASAYFVLCALSSLIGAFFPSVGAYVTYGLDWNEFTNINGTFGHIFLDSVHASREQTRFVLDLDNAAGVLTFPSVHAGVAALCAWATWPSRVLRWPFLALNLLMAASAVTNGGHYVIDIFGGAAVTVLAVYLTSRAAAAIGTRRLGREALCETRRATRPAVG